MLQSIIKKCLFCLLISYTFFSCAEEPEEKPPLSLEFPEQTVQDPRLNLNDYIKYKKLHSWGDSLYFLVISWGTDSTGSYTIMLADSTSGNYNSTTQYRQGGVVQSWINDFDRDNLPEIGIVTRSQNARRTGQMRLHELNRKFAFESIEMQPLSEQLGADYEGRDVFYPETGQIVREFRTLNLDSASDENDIKRIVYALDNNQLIVTEFETPVKEDSATVDQPPVQE